MGDGTQSQLQSQSQPAAIISEAFANFETLIRPDDACMFKSTTLEAVDKAIRIIERDQEQRRSMRNLRRIAPLLQSLAKFGGALETLCQGTPYLCYIWAPIKLLLQIADEYGHAFDQILDAYDQIAQHLPRLDRWRDAFPDNPEFRIVLATVYSDILEFHTHAYRYLRRGGWKRLFDASWRNFSTRFNVILQKLARGRELVDEEAHSHAVLEAKFFREKVMQDLERAEAERREWQLRDTLSWLDLKGQDREQDELHDFLSEERNQDTCDWVLENAMIRSWLDEEDSRPFLWLRGKPGAGKTTIATYLADHAPISPDARILYCLCSNGMARAEANSCSLIFRTLIAQILRKEQQGALLPHIYDNYVKIGVTPSLSRTRDLLHELLRASGPTFIIVDGLDECNAQQQQQVLKELWALPRLEKSSPDDRLPVKALVCSRETKEILSRMKKSPQVSLNEEKQAVSKDISTFVKAALSEIEDRFEQAVLKEIRQEIVKKADGMFLWVKLVLAVLIEQYSEHDLRITLKRLPMGLPGVYAAILERIRTSGDRLHERRVRHILTLVATSYRSLKIWEICDLIVFHEGHVSLTEHNKLRKEILDICKPFIEERDNYMISLVHSSAREYLLDECSGPYLSWSESHASIVSSCVRCLRSCMVFQRDLDAHLCGQVARGMFDIFLYAHQYWARHLMELIDSMKAGATGDEDQCQITITIAVQLLIAMAKPGTAISSLEASTASTSSNYSGELHDEILASDPTLLQDYLAYKSSSGTIVEESTISKDVVESTLSTDPTYISTAYSRYRKTIEDLLTESSPFSLAQMRITDNDIAAFRARHSRGSFLCRWPTCADLSTGFDSDVERAAHEKCHEQRFRCPEPACEFGGRGFPSKQALRQHKRGYHMESEDVDIPVLPISKRPKKTYHSSTYSESVNGEARTSLPNWPEENRWDTNKTIYSGAGWWRDTTVAGTTSAASLTPDQNNNASEYSEYSFPGLDSPPRLTIAQHMAQLDRLQGTPKGDQMGSDTAADASTDIRHLQS